AFDVSYNGLSDIFISKLNSAGSILIGSAFIGGSNDDGVNITATWATINTLKYSYCDDLRSEIYVDSNDDVYVSGCTRSANFPIVGGFQAALKGAQDGVVFKMNSTLTTLDWSSYLGGT